MRKDVENFECACIVNSIHNMMNLLFDKREESAAGYCFQWRRKNSSCFPSEKGVRNVVSGDDAEISRT